MRFALIGTFHKRHENSFPLMHRVYVASSRKPDEGWFMCETDEDAAALNDALTELYRLKLLDGPPAGLRILVLPTPRHEDGRYKVIPYSNKINVALSLCDADAVVYLDNGSMPGTDKFKVMAEALEEHDSWGGVYVSQKRTGFANEVHLARGVIEDGYCAVNVTQVMHRWTQDKWPTDMKYADPGLADAVFWREIHKPLGPFHPAGGDTVHDEHDMPHPTSSLAIRA